MTCQICGKPSRFSVCSPCHAERQQHLHAKAKARSAAWRARMTQRQIKES